MASKSELLQTAKEFNKVMALDPAIKTGTKRTVTQLESDVKEAGGEVRDDDQFSPEVEAVLVELGIREAKETEAAEEVSEEKTEATSKPTEEKTQSPATDKKVRYTRIMSVCDALNGYENNQDINRDDCAAKANKLYVKNAGGSDNVPESLWATKMVFQVIEGLQQFKVKI
jgi:hypothetical protein